MSDRITEQSTGRPQNTGGQYDRILQPDALALREIVRLPRVHYIETPKVIEIDGQTYDLANPDTPEVHPLSILENGIGPQIRRAIDQEFQDLIMSEQQLPVRGITVSVSGEVQLPNGLPGYGSRDRIKSLEEILTSGTELVEGDRIRAVPLGFEARGPFVGPVDHNACGLPKKILTYMEHSPTRFREAASPLDARGIFPAALVYDVRELTSNPGQTKLSLGDDPSRAILGVFVTDYIPTPSP